MFCLGQLGPACHPDEMTSGIGLVTTKHKPAPRRLTDMHAPMRQITFSAVRIGAMVALAMLLILGLLPAILSVQAASQ
jgi:hypothetical protein